MHIINWLSFAIYLMGIIPLFAWAEDLGPTTQIEWRVENPFPFIKNVSDYSSLKIGLEKIKTDGKFDSYSSAVENSYNNTMWDRETSTYDRSLVHGEITSVEARVRSSSPGDICVWKGQPEEKAISCEKWRKVSIKPGIENNLSVDIQPEGHERYSLHTSANITKRVILGLGDSFSSGEGNPDRQARWDESKITRRAGKHYQRNWPTRYEPDESEQADWNDVKCHRSLYSWQFLHALNQAGSDPHQVVVFVSFSCSGAEIYDGLLVQQNVTLKDPEDNRVKAPDSQVNQAVDLLCRVNSNNREYKDRKHLIANRFLKINVKECPQSELVKPNEILLTIGGNDVGFGGLITWSAFPGEGYWWFSSKFIIPKINRQLELKAGMICPERNLNDDAFCQSDEIPESDSTPPSRFVSNDAFAHGWLKENMLFADNVLLTHFQVQPKQIVQLTYPSPTSNEDGNTCTFQQGATPSRALKNELFLVFNRYFDWSGPLLGNRYKAYSVGPTKEKLEILNGGVVNQLQKVIQSAERNSINVVDVGREFARHGYCSKSSTWELEMPTRENQTGNNWWPIAPKKHDAFKVVNRWFRTPNDAQLGMLYDSFYKEKGWIGGMLHPNHLGHYSMFSTLEKIAAVEELQVNQSNSVEMTAR